MLESFISNFEYKKLSPEEQEKRGILGRLVGIIADTKNPTRNGRIYSESLWNKVFENPIMKEKIKNRCVFGELGHPEDRTEIDIEKVAICLAEEPKKGNDGKLYGVFDILSTPNGKILKSLCDYGCTIGVSSRGSGDTYTDNNGNEAVDPETYDCIGWDAVVIPAVESARMKSVNESLDDKNLRLRKALTEELNKASEADRKIMSETLNSLNIKLVDTPANDESVNINESLNNESNEATNDGADIAKEFLKTLKENKELVKQVKELQEQLSVCYTKESEYHNSVTELEDKVKSLSESLDANQNLQNEIVQLKEQVEIKNSVISRLKSSNEYYSNTKSSLTESVNNKDLQIKNLTEQLNSELNSKNAQIKSLNESVEELRKDATIKRADYQNSLSKSNELVEKYKNIARVAVDRYIKSQAVLLGVNVKDIKSKLSENYSFNDIDRVCESLKTYKLDVTALPFDTTNKNSTVRMKVTESKNESIKNVGIGGNASLDDDCDDQLMGLAGL